MKEYSAKELFINEELLKNHKKYLFKSSAEMKTYLNEKILNKDLVLRHKNIEDFKKYSENVRKEVFDSLGPET